MLEEYTTDDQAEMAYLHFCGFAYEFDRENERKVKMIVKGDIRLIRDELRDFWEERGNKYRTFLNSYKTIKRSLWIGGEFNPKFNASARCDNRENNNRTAKKK